MTTTPVHTYRERATAFRKQEEKHAQTLRLLSFLRLLLFAAAAWFVYRSFATRFAGNDLLFAFLFLVAFMVAVVFTSGIKRKTSFLQQLTRINENEIAIANGDPSVLDNGATLAPSSGFAGDLNVFGKRSLFHLLNRTGSVSGKKQLTEKLTHPFTTQAIIEDYQLCAKELAEDIEFRQVLLAHALLLKEEDALDALQERIPVESFAVLQNTSWSLLAVAWPLVGVASIVFSSVKGNFSWSMAVTLLGLMLIATILKKINLLYNHLSKRSYLYAQYAKCFALIASREFKHPYLRQKREEIIDASQAFLKLSRLTGLFDLRLSMLTLFFNGLFLFDLLCARAYLRWNAKYQLHIKTWFDTLGEIELLNSIATFHTNHPAFVFPSVDSRELAISASGMAHPLMNESTAVANDFGIGEPARLHLITGSNMSGKSTFLRTLGLNIVLAQIGAPVFAKHFVFHPVRLLTSFHHIDSLEESTSYFYAELKALKSIVDALQDQQPALVLLDEVMRGTNSKDKHDGSALLIKKLLTFNCLSLIATHDTELGDLTAQHPGALANFCFESTLTNNELRFDFLMHPGVAQTKNATFLMREMGIV